MDIRVVKESIFEIESDCIIYFVDNSFSSDSSLELISNAGSRICDVFSKISSLPTGEFKVVPAFNLETGYVVLTVIPEIISSHKDEEFLENIFERIIETFEDYEFNTVAIDISGLEKNFSTEHSQIFKDFLRKTNKDLVFFLCK